MSSPCNHANFHTAIALMVAALIGLVVAVVTLATDMEVLKALGLAGSTFILSCPIALQVIRR